MLRFTPTSIPTLESHSRELGACGVSVFNCFVRSHTHKLKIPYENADDVNS